MHESVRAVQDFKTLLRGTFAGTDTDSCQRFLGIDIERVDGDSKFLLTQGPLIDKIVQQCCGLPQENGWFLSGDTSKDSHVPMLQNRLKTSPQPVTEQEHRQLQKFPYREVLGAIGYVMTATRPTIAFAWKELSRFASCYRAEHIHALLVLVSYLRRTRDQALVLTGQTGSRGSLRAFCDADWNNSDKQRSTTGFIVFYDNSPIAWASKTQRASSKSTCEAELIALSTCASDVLHLRRLNDSLDDSVSYEPSTVQMIGAKSSDTPSIEDAKLFSDSSSALAVAAKPPGFIDERMRHVRTSYFFFRHWQQVNAGTLKLLKVSGTDNPSDLLSKGFSKIKEKFDTPDHQRKAKSTSQKGRDYFAKLAKRCMGHDSYLLV